MLYRSELDQSHTPEVQHTGVCLIGMKSSKLRQKLGYDHFSKESLFQQTWDSKMVCKAKSKWEALG